MYAMKTALTTKYILQGNVAESEEELKSLLMKVKVMKVKEESEKVGSAFRKLRSWHLVPSLHGK